MDNPYLALLPAGFLALVAGSWMLVSVLSEQTPIERSPRLPVREVAELPNPVTAPGGGQALSAWVSTEDPLYVDNVEVSDPSRRMYVQNLRLAQTMIVEHVVELTAVIQQIRAGGIRSYAIERANEVLRARQRPFQILSVDEWGIEVAVALDGKLIPVRVALAGLPPPGYMPPMPRPDWSTPK